MNSFRVWGEAAVQVFYSLSTCTGGLIMLSSYNRFHNNVFRDIWIIGIVDLSTSLLVSSLVFSAIGFVCYEMDLLLDQFKLQGKQAPSYNLNAFRRGSIGFCLLRRGNFKTACCSIIRVNVLPNGSSDHLQHRAFSSRDYSVKYLWWISRKIEKESPSRSHVCDPVFLRFRASPLQHGRLIPKASHPCFSLVYTGSFSWIISWPRGRWSSSRFLKSSLYVGYTAATIS